MICDHTFPSLFLAHASRLQLTFRLEQSNEKRILELDQTASLSLNSLFLFNHMSPL